MGYEISTICLTISLYLQILIMGTDFFVQLNKSRILEQ
jgi:hypothetical protein